MEKINISISPIENTISILERYKDLFPMDAQESIDFAIFCLRKGISKKVIKETAEDREFEDFCCPHCKDILQQRRKGATRITIHKYRRCDRCGQVLDWEGVI